VRFPAGCRLCAELLRDARRLPLCDNCLSSFPTIPPGSCVILADSQELSILNFPKLSPSARIASSAGLPSNSRAVMASGLPNISSNSFAARVTGWPPTSLYLCRFIGNAFPSVSSIKWIFWGGPWLVVCDSLIDRSFLCALVGARKNICYAVMSAGRR
jgi:hypothetical protein